MKSKGETLPKETRSCKVSAPSTTIFTQVHCKCINKHLFKKSKKVFIRKHDFMSVLNEFAITDNVD